ncbi:DUF2092 domain-containing protein [Noviherbaspirillum pedocola]|nr:DUF2092 domain-containing protein [Noviherbaspirillum pedocola]
MKTVNRSWHGTVRVGAVLATALLVAHGALAQTSPPPAAETESSAAQEPSQKTAHELLMRMARFLAGAKQFSVTVLDGYDAVQESGEKIEFGARRKLLLARPDHLLVETERSDGFRSAAVFTGKEIVLTDFVSNVYASTPQDGNLDEGIVRLVRDLGIHLPLALLLTTRAPQEFEARVRSIEYVEKTNLLGTPAHHLAARGDSVDFQVWVADGDKPVPLRIVITYKTEPGQPQFRAQLSDWNLDPKAGDAAFAPRVPPGAQKIAFAAQLAKGASDTAKAAQGDRQ